MLEKQSLFEIVRKMKRMSLMTKKKKWTQLWQLVKQTL